MTLFNPHRPIDSELWCESATADYFNSPNATFVHFTLATPITRLLLSMSSRMDFKMRAKTVLKSSPHVGQVSDKALPNA